MKAEAFAQVEDVMSPREAWRKNGYGGGQKIYIKNKRGGEEEVKEKL